MKAYSKKVSGAKYNLEIERKKEEHQKWLASLTDEEREQYFAEEEKKRKRGRKALAQFLSLASVIDEYYTIKGGRK